MTIRLFWAELLFLGNVDLHRGQAAPHHAVQVVQPRRAVRRVGVAGVGVTVEGQGAAGHGKGCGTCSLPPAGHQQPEHNK